METNIEKLLTWGVEEVIVKEHLEKALASGKKLRVKLGADPTAPDLHLGNAVALRKLKQFQDLGHQVVFIIGDYTAKIGDPSEKSKTRPMLSEKEIEENAKTYLKQAGKILDIKKAKVLYNSEWYSKENDWALNLASKFTVQRILERDDFSKRMKSKTEIYLHELLYPAMQAYDSVKIQADVEIGGTDQKFNMLAGRDLQRRMGLAEQDIVTVPLLVGTDGQKKMSKSLGNYIGIAESPDIMFGKIMSAPDELIDQYYLLCANQERKIEDPRDAKLELAKIIVSIYHGEDKGQKSKEEFVRVFSQKEKPENIPAQYLETKNIKLADLLVEIGAAASRNEARRLIEQNAVRVNDEKKNNPEEVIKIEKELLIQTGKRKFLKIRAR